jgi:hypothetical protein
VGSAFENERTGQITVYLDSAPYPDKDGRVALMLFEPKERQESGTPAKASGTGGSARPLAEEIDDEIPF